MTKLFKFLFLNIFMTWLELYHPKGIKGIFVDGFMPDISFLRKIDWEWAKKEKIDIDPGWQFYLSTPAVLHYFDEIKKLYLEPDSPKEPSPSIYRRLYKHLIYDTRQKFCRDKTGLQKHCTHYTFSPSELKSIMYKSKYRDKIFREIDHNLAKGKINYLIHATATGFNFNKQCDHIYNCIQNWIDFLGFQLKPERDYVYFDEFRKGMENFFRRALKASL